MSRAVLQQVASAHTPESLAESLRGVPGLVLLHGGLSESGASRYSFVTADPFLAFRSSGSRCEITGAGGTSVRFGNPWRVLEQLLDRFELRDQADLPFPLGGCFGYWGYDLRRHVESRWPCQAEVDLDLPDTCVGFYDSLVVFDHRLGRTWIVSTGLAADASRSADRAQHRFERWAARLENQPAASEPRGARAEDEGISLATRPRRDLFRPVPVRSNLTRAAFLAIVRRAQSYIQAGDIYQVNLAQRLQTPAVTSGWELFRHLTAVSPAPFAAFLDCGGWQLVSSSPELFLRISGNHIQTRPIKGTRPRAADPTRDAQFTYELQTSPKEMAELVMITDLLRNDLGRVCDYGSVQVPELVRLERFAQVQHLVSTVEGQLRAEVPHLRALAACFPGGSITGAPKIRAMQIIDELEPVSRGPYTGCLGYLGFNGESQLAITIRSAICLPARTYFHVGAGIVADSIPEAEYEETVAKAGGFFAALESASHRRAALAFAANRS
jgi:para-aminobenzoate synthetase component 1